MASHYQKIEQTAGGLRCVAISDVGMRRASNQDSLAIALAGNGEQWNRFGHLLVVADGMGAHAAGELASKIATDTIPHSYHKQATESPSEAIVAAVRAANEAIYTKGQNTVDFQGMGTTCSSLVLLPGGALAAHVGDSRVYRLRCELFEQLTFDHSLVWEMAAAGHATEEEVPAYVPKNVITRSLGPHETVAVDIEGPFPLQSRDRFLLCSDGLTGPLKPELIGVVLGALPIADVAQTLVDLANLLGGPDNITVIVAEVVDAKQLGAAELVESSAGSKHKMPGSGGNASWWHPLLNILTLGLWKGPTCPQMASQELGGLQGKAPYRQHECKAGSASIETLSDIVRQLEDLRHQREWNFDWQEILNHREQAHEAIAKTDYTAAVVAYCNAVRLLMQSLREPSPGDSKIDLG